MVMFLQFEQKEEKNSAVSCRHQSRRPANGRDGRSERVSAPYWPGVPEGRLVLDAHNMSVTFCVRLHHERLIGEGHTLVL